MARKRISGFEMILLVVGVTTAVLGFNLINQVYILQRNISWLMVIAIFNWLMLLVLFISLSLGVDTSRKQLAQMELMVYLLNKKKGNK